MVGSRSRRCKCSEQKCKRLPINDSDIYLGDASAIPCNAMSKELEPEPGDFHLAVKRRPFTTTPGRWEIWAAVGRSPRGPVRGLFRDDGGGDERGRPLCETFCD